MAGSFAALLLLLIGLSSGQQCRHLTVCDDDVTLASSSTVRGSDGEKGEQGRPGKAGPPAMKGDKGEMGAEGQKGEIGDLGRFNTELKQMFQEIKLLATPASCLGSSVYGKQHLRSGEEVFCDNGWTVFQRRFDGSVTFDRDWTDYKSGFGNMSGEFWLGLDKIHQLTAYKGCRMRVDLWSFDDEHAFAEYSSFQVEDENDLYRLHIGGYTGIAGDGIAGSHSLDKMAFTTRDRDNDESGSNCANSNTGGWWFKSCTNVVPNARWGRSTGAWRNIVWFDWKGHSEALKSTLMKLRCD